MRSIAKAALGLLVLVTLWSTLAETPQAAGKARTPATVAAEIDQIISKLLAENKVPASGVADDAEFLRRVSLDITGRVPKIERVRAFLADSDPAKRRKLVDELLADSEYGEHFGIIWYHLMVKPDDDNRQLISDDLQDWLADRFNQNQGWDKIVTDLLTASGPRDKNPQTVFFLANVGADRQPEPNKLTAAASHLFLGVKLECCECHNHPFSTLKQNDFWGMAAFFTHTHGEHTAKKDAKSGTVPAIAEGQATGKAAKLEKKEGNKAPPGSIVIPDTKGTTIKARFLLAEEPPLGNKTQYRPTLAAWVTAPKNPYFGKAAVNRMWANLFGKGIVTPVDDMRPESRSTHPELIKLLTDEFIASGFDLKHLIRCICLSQTYQRSSQPSAENKKDEDLYSHANPRMLTADMLYDSLAVVLDHAPADKTKGAGKKYRGGARDQFRKFFHTEADDDVSAVADYSHGIPQALRLMNSSQMNNTSGVLGKLVKAGGTPDKIIESIYLTALARRPTAAEAKRMAAYVAADPAKGYADVFWALLNSSEFVFNH